MKQTMLLKLAPTEEQHRALLDTMHAFNEACNFIAEQAFEAKVANKFELQKMAYGELRTTYHLPAQLATLAGIPLYTVDPRNTSRTCSQCGHCEKANRKSQASFVCQHCGFACNADINAALNISRAEPVKQPMAAGRA